MTDAISCLHMFRPARLCFAATVLTAAFVASAQAQTFPSRTVRISTPYSTGIGPDIASRLVAEKLGKVWNQSVIVEPRPGASGAIAVNAVRKANPDGHELLVLGNAHLAVNPVLIRDWNIDLLAEFTPAQLLYNAYFVITVAANAPNSLFFNCEFHVQMTGNIQVIDGGPPDGVFADSFE